MADKAPLLRGDFIAVIFKAAQQSYLQGQGGAVDDETQGVFGRIIIVHKINYN
jgi:hypothetical protein